MKPINHSILIKVDKSPQQILKKAEFLFMFFFNSCISLSFSSSEPNGGTVSFVCVWLFDCLFSLCSSCVLI